MSMFSFFSAFSLSSEDVIASAHRAWRLRQKMLLEKAKKKTKNYIFRCFKSFGGTKIKLMIL